MQKAQSQAANNQKDAALQTLSSTKKIIASISPSDQATLNSIEQKDKKPSLSDIQNTISNLEDKLQSIVRVSGTAVYTNPQSNAIYSVITDLGDSVYAINQTTGEVTASLKNGSSSKSIGTNSDLKGVLSLSSSTTTNSLFALTSDSVYQIKPDGTISKQAVVGTLPSSAAIASYLQNIYLLSPSDNQIYRFAKSSSGLGTRNPYIKKPTANLLTDATSMSVNGNVFVSLRNGDVLLFDQGVQKDFQITGKPVDDQDIAQLAYSNSPEQLIQLNPIKKAFIITSLRDGGGEFTKEIIVNTTSEVSSFAFDSKTKSVFFTSDNTIQKFTLE